MDASNGCSGGTGVKSYETMLQSTGVSRVQSPIVELW